MYSKFLVVPPFVIVRCLEENITYSPSSNVIPNSFASLLSCFSFLNKNKFFILSSLFFLGLISAYIFRVLDTILHELSHLIQLSFFVKRNPNFKQKHKYHIELHGYIKNKGGILYSNYYQFIYNNKSKYLTEIQRIAFAGVLYTTTFYTLCFILLIYLYFLTYYNIIFFFLGFTLMYIALEISSYNFVPYLDITGKIKYRMSSDKRIHKHPETFSYKEKDSGW